MIKICFIIGQFSRHGAERQLYELVKGLNKNEFEPVVISLSEGGYWGEEIQKLNVEVIELQRLKKREFSRLFKLVKLLKIIKPHIIHTYMFSANSYGRIAAILAKVPIIIASERSSAEMGKDKNRYRIFIDKMLALISDGIICNSYKCAENLINKYSLDSRKIFTVHNCINPIDFVREHECNSKNKLAQKVIGTVGRLDHVKNHKLFLDIAKIVLDNYDDENIEFIIVGEGSLRDELQDYCKKLGIEDNVVFTGERSDIPELLETFDVFVMTSFREGMSNAIMEAMLSAVPIVATDVGGNSELIIDGETGFLCPSNNEHSLADRILTLIGNTEGARRMGENGKQRMLNEFGVDKMIMSTSDIYKKLITQKNILPEHNNQFNLIK